VSSRHLSYTEFYSPFPSVPPYGASEADLQTIFDVSHLKKTSYLLNTQCEPYRASTSGSVWSILRALIFSSLDRLPVPLGGFISEVVYEGKLHSSHNIVDHSCVVFIDVGKGKEARKGKSYQASFPGRETVTKLTFVRAEHRGGPHGSPGCQAIS
jgi:regulator of nonsense transcripts 1